MGLCFFEGAGLWDFFFFLTVSRFCTIYYKGDLVANFLFKQLFYYFMTTQHIFSKLCQYQKEQDVALW